MQRLLCKGFSANFSLRFPVPWPGSLDGWAAGGLVVRFRRGGRLGAAAAVRGQAGYGVVARAADRAAAHQESWSSIVLA
jgi:hypothetical protein